MRWMVRRTLRAWHLAILRFAVTLDNADRLAVLRIAGEIDRLDPRQDKAGPDFGFFRRTSAELCAAILQPNERASTVLRQYLARIDDDRLKRAFAAAIEAGQPAVAPISRPVATRAMTYGKGFPPAAIINGHCVINGAVSGRIAASRSAGATRDQEMLFPPFRSGTAHVVIFGMVSLDRPIPGRAEKCHQRPDDAAEKAR